MSYSAYHVVVFDPENGDIVFEEVVAAKSEESAKINSLLSIDWDGEDSDEEVYDVDDLKVVVVPLA